MGALRIMLVICWLASAAAVFAQEPPPGADAAAGPPKVAKAVFNPPRPRTGDRLALNLTTTGQALRVEVRWKVNDEDVQLSDALEAEAEVPLARDLRAGDRVEATATPFGLQNEQGLAEVRRIMIGNAPPLLRVVDQKIEGNVYRAKIEVSDPEGDPVALQIKEGPPGMRIDPSGVITWKFNPDTVGAFSVKVVGKDEPGGEAILDFGFSLKRSK
jgi:hypothetical protein